MKNNRLKIIKSILATTVVFIAIIVLCMGFSRYSKRYYSQGEFEDWVITVNDYAPYTGTLYDESYKGFVYGDKITLQKMITLPKDQDICVLRFFSRHFAEQIYVNNELVYENGLDSIEKGRAVGNHYAMAPLETDKDFCYITIVLTVGDYKSRALPYVYIENGFETTEHFNIDIFVDMIIAAIMVVIGVSMLFIIIVNKNFTKEYRKGIWIGAFALCVAGWTFCNYGILQTVVHNVYITYFITEISLFMMPIPMMLFINEYQLPSMKKKIYSILIAMFIVFNIITFTLEVTGIYSYTYFVPLYQMMTIVAIVYSIIMLFGGVKDNIDNIYLLVGVVYFGLSCLYDLARSYYHSSEKVFNFTQSVVPVGAFMFFASMVIFYANGVAKMFYRDAEQKMLFKLAYTDALTNLANRAKCEEYAKEIDEDKENTYAVISLDLNGLKYVNDTYGHVDGDSFIIGFAEILIAAFGKEKDSFIGRMGGDEFIVILKNCEPKKIQGLINNMNGMMHQINKEKSTENKFIFSAAYGVSIRTLEDTRKLWKVYEEADARMYECKKYQRDRLGIRVR